MELSGIDPILPNKPQPLAASELFFKHPIPAWYFPPSCSLRQGAWLWLLICLSLAYRMAFLFCSWPVEIFILILHPANVLMLLPFYAFPIMAEGLEQRGRGNL